MYMFLFQSFIIYDHLQGFPLTLKSGGGVHNDPHVIDLRGHFQNLTVHQCNCFVFHSYYMIICYRL